MKLLLILILINTVCVLELYSQRRVMIKNEEIKENIVFEFEFIDETKIRLFENEPLQIQKLRGNYKILSYSKQRPILEAQFIGDSNIYIYESMSTNLTLPKTIHKSLLSDTTKRDSVNF